MQNIRDNRVLLTKPTMCFFFDNDENLINVLRLSENNELLVVLLSIKVCLFSFSSAEVFIYP